MEGPLGCFLGSTGGSWAGRKVKAGLSGLDFRKAWLGKKWREAPPKGARSVIPTEKPRVRGVRYIDMAWGTSKGA